ncbi:hypothetical protein SEA_RIPARIAN_38 [Mycobacterium phage Riparian]|uniref:Uncharacterized protein n=1 Tax=Mycobacterium phage Riparian TaxID=2341079 RepID=A0A3G3LWN6_9CAUD|nr:hypothetical protein SEA_RIPARIAN_38 [Mycobacterium phage Riparian]
MKVLESLITQAALVTVAAISAVGGIYSTYANRKQNSASADKTKKEGEQVGDQTWIRRLEALSQDFEKLQKLSDERFERLVEIEMLITEHVSWDFRIMRLLREHGIEAETPPSLVYVRHKLKEAQEQEKSLGETG